MPKIVEDFDRRNREIRNRRIARIVGGSGVEPLGARDPRDLLRFCWKRGTAESRDRLLDSPLLAGWTEDVLFWKEVLDLSATPRAGSSERAGDRRLFERVARTEFLTEIVPGGRIDTGFRGRARRRAIRILRERWTDLPRILAAHLPPSPRRRSIRLRFREVPDEGLPGNQVRFGESGLTAVWPDQLPPASFTAQRAAGEWVVPAPVRLGIQETIPGTAILIAHRLISTPASLRVGARVPTLGRRLARALELVEQSWPRAAREIAWRTWLLVPLIERRTVSYSHAARPGISYINVARGGLCDLADDLLHETAHHRLHARQEAESFLRDDGEPYSYSPWRRTPRPLNGILHGTFTFLYRAELFLRMERSIPSLSSRRREWLRAEAGKELEHCGTTLKDLSRAKAEGLVTPAGARLIARMARRREALRRRRLWAGGRPGRV